MGGYHFLPPLMGGFIPQIEGWNLHSSGEVYGGGRTSFNPAALFGSPEEDEIYGVVQIKTNHLLAISGVEMTSG